MIDIHSQLPVIEYQGHPAFSSIDPGKHANNDVVFDILNELKSHREKLHKTKSIWSMFSKTRSDIEQTKTAFRIFISESHKQLDIIKQEIFQSRNDWSVYESNAIDKLVETIKNEVVADTRVLWWQSHAPENIVVKNKKIYDGLVSNGYTSFQLDNTSTSKLRNLVSPLEADLRQLNTSNPTVWACKLIDSKIYPEFTNYLKGCLSELGILSLAGSYLKRDVFIEYTHLNLSRPEDEWWRTRYKDVHLDLPATAGLHYDSSAGMMKVMLYLNDVQLENGPFCYMPNTKPAYTQTDFFRKLSGKAVPYAGIMLENQESRRLMLRLPDAFRNISHFGDDLLIGSNLEKSYQRMEKQFIGNSGLGILFDNYGLHRGGLTEQGERIALQISLRAIDSYSLL